MSEIALSAKGIDKKFPGVHALKSVDFSVEKGEIHALLGENGAGKSTLMKILAGVERYDSGTIEIFGKTAHITQPSDAQKYGFSVIHQELSLFNEMDIATNIFIQTLPANRASLINSRKLYSETKKILEEIGLSKYSPSTKIKKLQMGERQLVEIARCLVMDTKILVLDEPTSSLTKKEVEMLFSIMRKLKEKGISMIFITHRLDEVFEICDRITVMRDGRIVETLNASETNTHDIVTLMIGRELEEMFQREHIVPGKELLRVSNLCSGERFQNISFSVHEGEIVGLYGLMGSGRSEIVRSIFGLDHPDSGEIYVDGSQVTINKPVDAIENGIGLITENRREEGLILKHSVRDNLVVANLPFFAKKVTRLMDEKKIEETCRNSIDSMNIKTPTTKRAVQFLSGGNQQKVVISKWLNCAPKVLMLDEPTRGVDVGAKHEIYTILGDLAKEGKGAFIISSEINEIMGLCDKIMVIRKGRIVAEHQQSEFNKNVLMAECMGGD